MSRRRYAAALLPLLLLTGCGGGEPAAPAPAATEPALAVPTEPTGTGPAEPTDSGSGGGAEGTSLPDACALMTKADAQKLVGMTLLDGVGTPGDCTYNSDPTGPTGQVFVAVGDGAKKTYDINRTLKHEFRALPGVADEAWAEDGAVYVRKGAMWVVVSMIKLNDPKENVKPLAAAARTVAGRL